MIASVEFNPDNADEFATLERELRAFVEKRANDAQLAQADLARRRQAAVLDQLTMWLSAIIADRNQHSV